MQEQGHNGHFFLFNGRSIDHVHLFFSTVTLDAFEQTTEKKKKKVNTNTTTTLTPHPSLFQDNLPPRRKEASFAMFSSIQSAKRKVITFGDDGEQVSRPTNPSTATESSSSSSSSSSAKKHNDTQNGTTKHNGSNIVQDKTSSSSSSTTASSTSEETGQRLSKKQKRQLQHQQDSRPKKLINKEPTTEAMTQKAKELKKHRNSLPIYTGEFIAFYNSEESSADEMAL